MTVDISNIQNEFIRVAEDYVGSDLYSTSSVYKSRDDFPRDRRPYITFDILSIDDNGGWLLNEGVNENDEPFYTAQLRMLLQYTVYGDNAMYIAGKLRNAFRLNRILNEITTNTCGGIENVYSVDSLPQRIATRYEEVASFNLTFTINDTTTDPLTGIITTINLDGSLQDEGQITEVNMDVNVTSEP